MGGGIPLRSFREARGSFSAAASLSYVPRIAKPLATGCPHGTLLAWRRASEHSFHPDTDRAGRPLVPVPGPLWSLRRPQLRGLFTSEGWDERPEQEWGIGVADVKGHLPLPSRPDSLESPDSATPHRYYRVVSSSDRLDVMTNALTQPQPAADWQVYAEDWDPAYGSPATFDIESDEPAEQAEPGVGFVRPDRSITALHPIAFIDGVRRAEMSMWAEQALTGERVPGLAGAFAVGAVTVRPGGRPAEFEGARVGRLAIWGNGHNGSLESMVGYRWTSTSITSVDPADLLAHLQDSMRRAEGDLALEAAHKGWHVVLDGPLNRIRSLDSLVTGYVKTHRRVILPATEHAAVPRMHVGERTRMYTAGTDRYTCYIRVGDANVGGSPWGGIARLDFPSAPGLDEVVARADRLTALLPTYAGVAHRDPRAPVNLTPVRNLESHLRRLMGPVELATRAARDALMNGGLS